jgi:hypothetical protein
VFGGAAVMSILLMAVLLGSRPGGRGNSGLAPPTPTYATATFRPPGDEPSEPAPVPSTQPSPGTPSGTPTPRAPRPAPSYPPPYRLAAVAGESCPQTAVSGYYRRGWYSDWYARSYGGWTGDGCAGRVVSVPMSGSRYTDDRDNVVVWWFRLPPGVTGCAVAVFVPDTGHVLDAAGAPATYLVYATTYTSGTPFAEITVDQVHNQGRWVDAGTVHPPGDQLAVRLATRGIDFGPGRAGAHLGVSALRARC